MGSASFLVGKQLHPIIPGLSDSVLLLREGQRTELHHQPKSHQLEETLGIPKFPKLKIWDGPKGSNLSTLLKYLPQTELQNIPKSLTPKGKNLQVPHLRSNSDLRFPALHHPRESLLLHCPPALFWDVMVIPDSKKKQLEVLESVAELWEARRCVTLSWN